MKPEQVAWYILIIIHVLSIVYNDSLCFLVGYTLPSIEAQADIPFILHDWRGEPDQPSIACLVSIIPRQQLQLRLSVATSQKAARW